jgi:galactokinase
VRVVAERLPFEPAGVWAAPGRVNLIGEHTDYNDGYVLPLAIDRVARVAAARRPDTRLRVWSTREPDPVECDLADAAAVRGWAGYLTGVAWALGVDRGADLLVDSDVPVGAGLSSSAAVECATALALAELFGLADDRTGLARACQRAENEVVGAPTGIMDQMASLHGRAGSALFLDCRTLVVEPVPLDLSAAGVALLVVDTRAAHDLAGGGAGGGADGGYAERREACRQAAAALGVPALRDATPEQVEGLPEPLRRRARHVVTENVRVLAVVDALRAGRWESVGRLLAASHTSLRDDFEVSVAELDTAATAVTEAGALGARLTGGGFGGSIVALLPADRVDTAAAGVRDAFADRGWPLPQSFPVAPADGARRLR